MRVVWQKRDLLRRKRDLHYVCLSICLYHTLKTSAIFLCIIVRSSHLPERPRGGAPTSFYFVVGLYPYDPSPRFWRTRQHLHLYHLWSESVACWPTLLLEVRNIGKLIDSPEKNLRLGKSSMKLQPVRFTFAELLNSL